MRTTALRGLSVSVGCVALVGCAGAPRPTADGPRDDGSAAEQEERSPTMLEFAEVGPRDTLGFFLPAERYEVRTRPLHDCDYRFVLRPVAGLGGDDGLVVQGLDEVVVEVDGHGDAELTLRMETGTDRAWRQRWTPLP